MGISGLEDEYELSAGMPRLLYVRRRAPGREPRLQQLIDRMQADGDASTTFYDDPAQLAELVADDLAVLLSERFVAPVDAPPGLAPGWLPTPAASLVDRRAELSMATELLGDPAVRLVTLTGPGGTGKTRLALAAAEGGGRDRDAVWWVDLSGVRDPAAVRGEVAAAVGVRAEGARSVLDVVAERLAGRRVLLVLDNLEQVLDAVPDLGRLLGRCPRTQLLVTSRTVLGLRGEQDVPLGPLAVPAPGERSTAEVTAAPAVQLFTARARRADPSFTVTEGTAPARAPPLVPGGGGTPPRRGRGGPPAGRPAAGARARRRAGPHPAAGGAGAPAVGCARPGARPGGRRRRRPGPPAHPAGHARLEPRPAQRAGARAARPAVGVRRRLLPGHRRGGRWRGRRRRRDAVGPRRPQPGGPDRSGGRRTAVPHARARPGLRPATAGRARRGGPRPGAAGRAPGAGQRAGGRRPAEAGAGAVAGPAGGRDRGPARGAALGGRARPRRPGRADRDPARALVVVARPPRAARRGGRGGRRPALRGRARAGGAGPGPGGPRGAGA